MQRLFLKFAFLMALLAVLYGCVQPFTETGSAQKFTVCKKNQPLQDYRVMTSVEWKEKCIFHGAPGGANIKCRK